MSVERDNDKKMTKSLGTSDERFILSSLTEQQQNQRRKERDKEREA